MNSKDLTYVKKDSFRGIEENREISYTPKESFSKTVNFKDVSSNYMKRDISKEPETFIIMISGGKKREKDYFRLILDNPNLFPALKCIFIAQEKKLHPQGLLEIAKLQIEHYSHTENEQKPDEYYLITDIDHFKDQVLDIKQECTSNINLIISNPCFEVWLYYSWFNDKFTKFSIPKRKSQLSKSVKKFVGDSIAGGIDPTKSIYKLETNIKNSLRNYALDKCNNIPDLFSTDMHKVGRKILPFIKSYLDSYSDSHN